MYQYNTTYPNELYHYGVKGMKWGVRRYQNPDGSLTDAGKKRYSEMSPNKVRKTMQKEVNRARVERYGGSNRWMRGRGIGEHSDKVHAKQRQDLENWRNSDAYKKAVHTSKKLEDMYWDGKIDDEEYDRRYHKAWSEASKTSPDINIYAVNGPSRQYTFNNYVNTVGRDLTLSYLKDLGYNDSAAKYIGDIIQRSGKHVLD